jgi:hypothetical protein
MDQVRLSKVSTERPVDRIQKEYVGDLKEKGGALKLRERRIEGVTEADQMIIERNPLMNKWDLEAEKQSIGRAPGRPRYYSPGSGVELQNVEGHQRSTAPGSSEERGGSNLRE